MAMSPPAPSSPVERLTVEHVTAGAPGGEPGPKRTAEGLLKCQHPAQPARQSPASVAEARMQG